MHQNHPRACLKKKKCRFSKSEILILQSRVCSTVPGAALGCGPTALVRKPLALTAHRRLDAWSNSCPSLPHRQLHSSVPLCTLVLNDDCPRDRLSSSHFTCNATLIHPSLPTSPWFPGIYAVPVMMKGRVTSKKKKKVCKATKKKMRESARFLSVEPRPPQQVNASRVQHLPLPPRPLMGDL